LQQAAVRNKIEQTQQAIQQAEIQRERLLREIQGLQRAGAAGAVQGGKNLVMLEAIVQGEDAEAYDLTSHLSKELQQYPWPLGYKPRILAFDRKTNPKKFLASYETAMVSAGGDTQTLAKSLIMAVEDIAHDWYTLFKPLSIDSWQQIKAELLSTFQSYQLGAETTRDLLNYIQRDDEPLSDYLERFRPRCRMCQK
jgi:hypothetical protein